METLPFDICENSSLYRDLGTRLRLLLQMINAFIEYLSDRLEELHA